MSVYNKYGFGAYDFSSDGRFAHSVGGGHPTYDTEDVENYLLFLQRSGTLSASGVSNKRQQLLAKLAERAR